MLHSGSRRNKGAHRHRVFGLHEEEITAPYRNSWLGTRLAIMRGEGRQTVSTRLLTGKGAASARITWIHGSLQQW